MQHLNGLDPALFRFFAAYRPWRVVGVHHNSTERDGKHLDVDCCIVFEFKDGRVIDGREHIFDLYAWDKFWS